MNLYISDMTLKGSANNLDNARLRMQLVWLTQILSNILHTNDLYADMLSPESTATTWGCAIKDYKRLILPLKNEGHSTVIWGSKSALYTLFLLNFYEECFTVYLDRIQSLVSHPLGNMYRIVSHWHRNLRNILPTSNMNYLCGLESDLYRNTPAEFEDIKDTVTAYQRYLIKQWKEDIVSYENLKDKRTAWDNLSETKKAKIPRPRLLKKLVWNRDSWGGSTPAFAKEELNAVVKELLDARGTRTTSK